MTRAVTALLGSGFLFAALPGWASPFDGTWKGDPRSAVVNAQPDEIELKGGIYTCKTCIPAYSTPADGRFHPVADRVYWDEAAVTVVDDRTVKIDMKMAGALIAENVRTVSADGNSIKTSYGSSANGAGALVEQSQTQLRVGKPLAGAHLISGAWRADSSQMVVSENALTITLKIDGDRLHLTSPLGETLDATLGGDYALIVGDPGKTRTKAALLAPDKLELTDMREGKIVQVTTYTVARDGRTINVAWSDPRDGSSGSFTATRI